VEGKVRSFEGKSIVEVGCGRGGGLNYISTYLNAAKCIGVDFSETQINFCKKTYSNNPKIQFY
jgi:cyclopropane fatty-acyl-phospholipid synthase-like methyltransferase